MAEMTCQAESELSALVVQLRDCIRQRAEPTDDPDMTRSLIIRRDRITMRLGERAAVLLPVLLDELRTLRSERK